MIRYATPQFSALQVELAYSTNSADGDLEEVSEMAGLSYNGVKEQYVELGYRVDGEDAIATGGGDGEVFGVGVSYNF